MSEKQIHFRVSEEEAKKLENHAKKTKRTKTDIVREFLRSLPWEVGAMSIAEGEEKAVLKERGFRPNFPVKTFAISTLLHRGNWFNENTKY